MDLASVDYVEKVINAYMGEHNSCCAKPLKIERIQNTAQGLYYSKLKERELEIVANGVIERTKLPEKAVNQRKNQKKNQRRTKRSIAIRRLGETSSEFDISKVVLIGKYDILLN